MKKPEKISDYLTIPAHDYRDIFSCRGKEFSPACKGAELGIIGPALANDEKVGNFNSNFLPAHWASFGLATGLAGRISHKFLLAFWTRITVSGCSNILPENYFRPPRLVFSTSDVSAVKFIIIPGLEVEQEYMALNRHLLISRVVIKSECKYNLQMFFSLLPLPVHSENFILQINPMAPVAARGRSLLLKKKYSLGDGAVSVDRGMGQVEKEFYTASRIFSAELTSDSMPDRAVCVNADGYTIKKNHAINNSGCFIFNKPGKKAQFVFRLQMQNSAADIFNDTKNIDTVSSRSFLIQRANDFFSGLPRLSGKNKSRIRLFYTCFQRMRCYRRNAFGPFAHPYYTAYTNSADNIFLWDSAFLSQAAGLRDFSDAENQFRNYFYAMEEDGRLPQQYGPISVSAGSNRPFLAWGVWNLFLLTGNISFLHEAYPYVLKNLKWYLKNRLNRDYTARLHTAGESGLDNFSVYIDDNKCNTKKMLTNRHLFWTVCYIKSVEILRKIGRLTRQSDDKTLAALEKKLHRGLASLYDPTDRIYYSFDNEQPLRIKTFEPLFCLWLENLPKNRVHDVMDYYRKYTKNMPWPVSSVSPLEECFKIDYWKGPVWIPTNAVFIQGLEQHGFIKEAAQLAEKTVLMVKNGLAYGNILHENYHPLTGKPSIIYPGGRSVETMWNTYAARLIIEYGAGIKTFSPPVQGNLYISLSAQKDIDCADLRIGQWQIDYFSVPGSKKKLLRLKCRKGLYQEKAVIEIKAGSALFFHTEFFNPVRGFKKIICCRGRKEIKNHGITLRLRSGETVRFELIPHEWRIDYSV